MKTRNFPDKIKARRQIALVNLIASEFTEKKGRTREVWQEQKDAHIEVLKQRIK